MITFSSLPERRRVLVEDDNNGILARKYQTAVVVRHCNPSPTLFYY
jgi:hypothetical protein